MHLPWIFHARLSGFMNPEVMGVKGQGKIARERSQNEAGGKWWILFDNSDETFAHPPFLTWVWDSFLRNGYNEWVLPFLVG